MSVDPTLIYLREKVREAQRKYDIIKLTPATKVLDAEIPPGNILSKKQISHRARLLKEIDKAEITYKKYLQSYKTDFLISYFVASSR